MPFRPFGPVTVLFVGNDYTFSTQSTNSPGVDIGPEAGTKTTSLSAGTWLPVVECREPLDCRLLALLEDGSFSLPFVQSFSVQGSVPLEDGRQRHLMKASTSAEDQMIPDEESSSVSRILSNGVPRGVAVHSRVISLPIGLTDAVRPTAVTRRLHLQE